MLDEEDIKNQIEEEEEKKDIVNEISNNEKEKHKTKKVDFSEEIKKSPVRKKKVLKTFLRKATTPFVRKLAVKSNLNEEGLLDQINNCLLEIDPRYFNPSFNLMNEIVNVFGDIDFEKVKLDIERLRTTNKKLDDVIRLIVDKHSEEFFKILGYVREMKKMLENSKIKYNYAQVSLGTIKDTISKLGTKENNEWKLKSLFYNEIILKLNQTLEILELINDCNIYIQNDKVFDSIKLLKSKKQMQYDYDKEFRQFNILVNINIRFQQIEKDIINKLIIGINNILFFNGKNSEILINKKIQSLILYFVDFYSKISIDTEVINPLKKFIYMINEMVNYKIEEELGIKFNEENNNEIEEKKGVEIDNNGTTNSLIYYLKCLRLFENPNVLLIFSNNANKNISFLITNICKITGDSLKNLYNILNKYDLDNKIDKIKFLLFVQIFLIFIFHSLSKTVILLKYTENNNVKTEANIKSSYEKMLLVFLYTFQKFIYNKNEELNDLKPNDILSFKNEYKDFFDSENIIKKKLSEINNIGIETIPICYKLFYQFFIECEELLNVKFNQLYKSLEDLTKNLFKFYFNKISSKNFFTLSSFIHDYDNDSLNFKFIENLTNQIDNLKRLLIFAFDIGYTEIMKIVKELFLRFFNDTTVFISKLEKDCIHHTLFNNLNKIIIKEHPNLLNELLINFQFRKYQKNIILSEVVINTESDKENFQTFNNKIVQFIFFTVQSTKANDNLYLITRNFKLMELLTKFILNTQSLLLMSENFLFDLMNKEFNQAKITAILEQVNNIAYDNISNELNVDCATLILISLTTFDKISYELLKILIILKIEFCCLLIPMIRSLLKNNYWLNEPQLNEEYFVISFLNDFTMYNNLFQYNLNEIEYAFIKKDYLLIINNLFIECIRNLPQNSINNFGVNLLIRDFNSIKNKLGEEFQIDNSEMFEKSIFYFENYVKLLVLNDDKLNIELKKYYDIIPFENSFIEPIITIRKNARKTFNEKERNKIISNIINN